VLSPAIGASRFFEADLVQDEGFTLILRRLASVGSQPFGA
jgi:hypothetical protein